MSDQRVVDEVSGSIWGSSGPPGKAVFMQELEEDAMLRTRLEARKDGHLNKIIGELESYLETSGEDWTKDQEDLIIDMLDAIEHTVKAQISENDGTYKG